MDDSLAQDIIDHDGVHVACPYCDEVFYAEPGDLHKRAYTRLGAVAINGEWSG